MSDYKPYPAYKDSGVEWIGEVPEHWEIARLKRVASLRTERCTNVPEAWQYVGLEDVESGTGRFHPTDSDSRQKEDSTVGVFRPGDVLYGKLRPYLKKTIVGDSHGVCSTEFLVLQPKSVMAQWLHQWLLTTEVTQQIEAGCEGTKMPRADWDHVGSIPVPYTSLSEQSETIAALDRETARIDTLIAKKTRFIELLEEKRSALITHAVTKGLDPNVKMKDSGVEWIGEVPEHWRISKLKYEYECRLGKMIQPVSTSIDDELVPYHRALTVQWERIDDEAVELMWASSSEIEKFSILVGDLLVCEGGDVCRSAIVREVQFPKLIFQNSIHRVRSRSEYAVDWVLRLMQHLRSSGWIDVLCNKNTIVHFTSEKLGDLSCPLPPQCEQNAIIAALDRETARIDTLVAKTKQSIDLLKERRSAFITAVITGQIDIRESA